MTYDQEATEESEKPAEEEKDEPAESEQEQEPKQEPKPPETTGDLLVLFCTIFSNPFMC